MEFYTKDVVSELIARRDKDLPSDAAASRLVQEVFAIVTDHLKVGDSVSISHFGTFHTILSAERDARNPATGENIRVPAKRRVRLRPGRDLRLALGDDGTESDA